MHFITAYICIVLPYRLTVKIESYTPIEKLFPDEDGKRVMIYPMKLDRAITESEQNIYLNDFWTLCIDITLPTESNDLSTKEKQEPFLKIADEYLNLFLSHMKTKSKQFWITPVSFLEKRYGGFQYKIEYKDESGELLLREQGTHGGIFISGVGINRDVWEKIKNDIFRNIKPRIIDVHMEEARSALFSRDMELLVINVAVAFEIFTSRFCIEYARKKIMKLA